MMLTTLLCLLASVLRSSCLELLTTETRWSQRWVGHNTETSIPSDPFGSVVGPLMTHDFPDPGVIYVDGVMYGFATTNKEPDPRALIRVQMAKSTDNETWTFLDHVDALPRIGSWQTGKHVWAPDVIRLPNKTFVLYYTDELRSSLGHHCIGAATSESVLGPYKPLDEPIACPDPRTTGGAIDPDGFLDPSTNKRYIVYKIDGNSLGRGGACNNMPPTRQTPIMLQEVSAEDGVTLIDAPTLILDRDELDGPLIEAPVLAVSIQDKQRVYFLLYSANCFTTPLYNVAYATATDIRGPYVKMGRPMLVTGDAGLIGPGGLDLLADSHMIVFHGHLPSSRGNSESGVAGAVAGHGHSDSDDHDQQMLHVMPRQHTARVPGGMPVRAMWRANLSFRGREISLAA
ncbi:hypothetical protein PV10_05414 [Exophiala mesophila]|uniref:Beta-xylosidase C-terminal Concanavalin A-like domain-containing protein n=1 Tax=Exophiala mesophila TaxID=212818 RepID=A0A0D1WP09_EXOME|nr:uncharacterized protein PV10_05414 [Exophiala mesophila]KIV90805.1 hypothetical protein PV10_05414 [Exophiala mesophila]